MGTDHGSHLRRTPGTEMLARTIRYVHRVRNDSRTPVLPRRPFVSSRSMTAQWEENTTGRKYVDKSEK